jgi:hypothetical protein
MMLLMILRMPVDSRSKLEGQAPSVMQLMVTVGEADSGSWKTLEASSRTLKTWMSFDTAYPIMQRVSACGIPCVVHRAWPFHRHFRLLIVQSREDILTVAFWEFGNEMQIRSHKESLSCILYSAADYFIFGNIPKARRNVPMTFLVMVDSYPATIL